MKPRKLGLEDDGKEGITLAGDKMRLQEHDDGSLTVTFDDKGTGRSCGGCQLCCKLVPVQSIGKPAGHRCRHQSFSKGCSIYASRPWDCRTWTCRWLSDPLAKGLSRPDRSHYVIDMQYDTLISRNEATGERHSHSMIQVWVDPAHPHAHRDPALRAYLQMMAERFHVAAVIRYSATDGFLLIAPALGDDGKWHERRDSVHLPREEFDAFSEGV